MKNNPLAYAEVNEILNLIEDEYVKRVPEKIRKFIQDEKDKEYMPKIDMYKPLEEQNLQRETIVLLAILNLNYWCNSEAEKKEFLNELVENEKNKQKELEEKYNIDNLFKKKSEIDKEENKAKENQLINYKEQSFIQRIWSKIKKLFSKNRKKINL